MCVCVSISRKASKATFGLAVSLKGALRVIYSVGFGGKWSQSYGSARTCE